MFSEKASTTVQQTEKAAQELEGQGVDRRLSWWYCQKTPALGLGEGECVCSDESACRPGDFVLRRDEQ